VDKLVLTHFSPREITLPIAEQAKDAWGIWPHAAKDGDSFEIPVR
jgi:ribonuclease BN (tRNA processing enzyme)